MASESKVVHGYWAIRGLGQPIRLVLEYAGISYEDKRYTVHTKDDGSFDVSEWHGPTGAKQALAGTELELPNLPYLMDGDIKITQTNAILLHLAQKAGIAGSTPAVAARAHMILCWTTDMRMPYVRMSYASGEAHASAKADIIGTHLPKYFKEGEALLKKSGGLYLCGSEFTFVDLVLYDLLDQFSCPTGLAPGSLADFPLLTAFYETIGALPSIAAYVKSDRFIDHPYNNLMASFK